MQGVRCDGKMMFALKGVPKVLSAYRIPCCGIFENRLLTEEKT